jgi:hypothetical protein
VREILAVRLIHVTKPTNCQRQQIGDVSAYVVAMELIFGSHTLQPMRSSRRISGRFDIDRHVCSPLRKHV